jgi:Ca-activated chloride channel family protein
MVADRGARIHVVSLGTPCGYAAVGEGMAIHLQLDEPTLRKVAQMTGGEYLHAGTAEALRSVFQTLGSSLLLRLRDTELTALLALAAAIVLSWRGCRCCGSGAWPEWRRAGHRCILK